MKMLFGGGIMSHSQIKRNQMIHEMLLHDLKQSYRGNKKSKSFVS